MATASKVVYIDLLLLVAALSFLMDYLLLWATAKATKATTGPWRITAAAAFGAGYFVAFYLSERSVIGYYGWLQFWPVILGASLIMIFLAFSPAPPAKLVRVTGLFYFIALSSGGAGMAAGYALNWGVPGQLAASIAAILITAELGWGAVQKSVWQRVYQLPVEIALFGERVRIPALLDSGNQLRDPLKGHKVIVVEHQAVAALLPAHLRDVIRDLELGDLSPVNSLLTSLEWSARFRVIPFASLGKKHGLLIGFRPDEAVAIVEGSRIGLENVVIGISPDRLDPEGNYQALLHPDLLMEAAPSGLSRGRPITSVKGESSHATTPS